MKDRSEVAKLLGIETSRLNTWIHLEYVEPSVRGWAGGNKDMFNDEDIRKIRAIKKLIDKGMYLSLAGKLVKEAKEYTTFTIRLEER